MPRWLFSVLLSLFPVATGDGSNGTAGPLPNPFHEISGPAWRLINNTVYVSVGFLQ